MNKTVVLVFFLFTATICFAQNNVTVIYEQDIRTTIFQRNITNTWHTSLSFYGDSMSIYRISTSKKQLLTPFDLNSPKVHHSTIHYKQSNLNEDVAYLYDSLILIQRHTDSLSWKILPDTKKICGELCYKATCGDKIVAWFASKLNTFSAPAYYYGLPGIILELKDERYNLTLKAQLIVYDVEPIIPSKKTISVLSNEEYIAFIRSKRKT